MAMVSFFRFDLKSENGKFEFACIKCNLCFKMTNGLKTHMLQHDGKKPNNCNQCGYCSRQIFQLHTVQIPLLNNLRSNMLKPIQEKNLSSARVQVMFGSIPPAFGVNTNCSGRVKYGNRKVRQAYMPRKQASLRSKTLKL